MVLSSVKLQEQDPNLTYAKKLSIDIGMKHATTPLRALHLKQSPQCESRLIHSTSVRGINEIYLKLTKEKIFLIDNNIDQLTKFGRGLRYIFDQNPIKDEINLLFFGYENKQPSLRKNTPPSDKEIEYLCNILSHPSSDVIIPPVIEGIKGDDYLEFLKKFLSRLKSFKTNPVIMGFFPFVATTDIRKIGSFYISKGINMFAVDFNGTNPLDFYTTIIEIQKFTNLMEKEFKTDSYLHGFNVPITKVHPNTNVGSAKDILTFTMGFGSFGTNHRPSKLPLHVIESIQKKNAKKHIPPIKPLSSSFRLFNRNDYGYYKYNDAKNSFQEPSHMSIEISDLMSKKFSAYQIDGVRKSFNVERQALEAKDIGTQIKEKSLKSYIENKKYGAENIRYIMRIFQN